MGGLLDLAAKQLWKLLVIWPAWALTPEGRRRIVTWRNLRHLILFAVMIAVTVAIAREMPWGAGVMLSGDMIAYLDVTLLALAAGLVTRLRDVVGGGAQGLALARRWKRAIPRPRAPRVSRPRRRPANDNDSEPGLGIAA